ncbi:hypothetical protein MK805_01155 [Shimazuella sp. AN120528]|nr:hypothetical protein [Shimazuella soli]
MEKWRLLLELQWAVQDLIFIQSANDGVFNSHSLQTQQSKFGNDVSMVTINGTHGFPEREAWFKLRELIKGMITN